MNIAVLEIGQTIINQFFGLKTSKLSLPNDLSIVLESVRSLLDEIHNKEGIALNVTVDGEADVIRIYGKVPDAVKRASSAISDILDLAYDTAEHHPFWNILYHSALISSVIIDKWNSELALEQIDELKWRVDEIKHGLERIENNR